MESILSKLPKEERHAVEDCINNYIDMKQSYEKLLTEKENKKYCWLVAGFILGWLISCWVLLV